MPISIDPKRDDLAHQLQPYFVEKMLIATDANQKILLQIIHMMVKELANWTPSHHTNAEINTLERNLTFQVQGILQAYENAIMTNQLVNYRHISNELAHQYYQWLRQNKILLNLSNSQWLGLSLCDHQHHIPNDPEYCKLQILITGWQLEILNVIDNAQFQVVPFIPKGISAYLIETNLYEIGLNELSDPLWKHYLLSTGNAKQMNELVDHHQFPAYQILQGLTHPTKKQRQAIQNVFIFTKAHVNPRNLTTDDRKSMYYHDLI